MIKIERVRPEEIPEVERILSETWVDTYGGFLSPKTIEKVKTVWHDPKLLLRQAQDTEAFFGVAKDGDRIVGLMTVRKVDDKTLMIYRLYVHPKYQRQGIGSKMLKSVLHEFPHVNKMKLEVEEQNIKGMTFYKKQGFKEVGCKEDRIGYEVMNVIVMEKIF